MASFRPILAIGASLFVLGGASLLDVARMQPQQMSSVRGDRQDVKDPAVDCKKASLIAACASNSQGSMTSVPRITLIQVYEQSNETTLVRVKTGN